MGTEEGHRGWHRGEAVTSRQRAQPRVTAPVTEPAERRKGRLERQDSEFPLDLAGGRSPEPSSENGPCGSTAQTRGVWPGRSALHTLVCCK